MAAGTVVRFDDAKGYGFIAPDQGGEDVFVHVNDLSVPGAPLTSGTRVEFGITDGGRGLKAYDVSITEAPNGGPPGESAVAEAAPKSRSDGEETCDAFTRSEFTQLATELLLTHGPALTAKQVVELREALVDFASAHNWIVD
jgi:cold shock CspA family protein